MKLLTILLLGIPLLGCDNVAPPTNAQVSSVAALCEKKGKEIEVFYNSDRVSLTCK